MSSSPEPGKETLLDPVVESDVPTLVQSSASFSDLQWANLEMLRWSSLLNLNFSVNTNRTNVSEAMSCESAYLNFEQFLKDRLF